MTVRVGIVSNPFDPRAWVEHETDDVHSLLMAEFPTWPDSARIYNLEDFGDWKRAAALVDPAILAARDVTPRDRAGIDRLGQLRGPLLVTITPADPITAIVTVVAIALGVAISFLLLPKLPGATKQPSPNNALTDRQNQARPNGRIADIYGTVEATPDLLAVPYTLFQNNIEVEVAYMCLGRGSYSISRVRDGDTNFASISGASVAVYGPGTSPNSGDPPELQIGPAIAEVVKSVVKLNDVNGQTLKPTNLNFVQGEDSIRFVYPDKIESIDPDFDLTDFFGPGDSIQVANADISGDAGSETITASARFLKTGEIEFETLDPTTEFTAAIYITIVNGSYAGDNGSGGVVYLDVSGTYLISSVTASPARVVLDDPAGVNSDWDLIDDLPADRTEYRSINMTIPVETSGINLNGAYVTASVGPDEIVLSSPHLVNAAWNNLDDLPGGATAYVSPSISRTSDVWVGPFIVDLADGEQVLANIVALNGLYTLSKKKGKQVALAVGVQLEITPINSSDTPIGAAELFNATIFGSQTERVTIGYSLLATPTFSGRSSVRMRRTSPSPLEDDFGAISDEVKWRDCYGLADIDETEFGDVTTVMARTVATAGALSIKSRKLNMRVTRKLPIRIAGDEFGAPAATNSAADIISAMALDPFIGRRSLAEIDFDNIYDTIEEIQAYFGTVEAGQFGFTFDDSDVSFEETIQTVAQAVYCQAYRQGRVIRIAFERATNQSSLLFNARNTLPGSQTRTVRFGPLDDHDGIELDYNDPLDGAKLTYSIPLDRSATSPRSVEVSGVRSHLAAYFHSWRAWNKTRYQNVGVEFEATSEAALLIPLDRILVADQTRPEILEGDCTSIAGTTLGVSQKTALDPGVDYTIFLQHSDGTIQALGATQGANSKQIILSAAPSAALSVDQENFARATYMIVPETDVQSRAFLVAEREPQDSFTEVVRAINYSFLYYQNDQLLLWLGFGSTFFFDSGPHGYDGAESGSAELVADDDRARDVYSADAADASVAFAGLVAPASYTKAAWINLGVAAAGNILGSIANAEHFRIAGGQLEAGHGAAQVSIAAPAAGEWHHVAVAYDGDSEALTLYLDGRAVDSALAVARGPVGALTALDGLIARADDIRLWTRALEADEIWPVFLAGKMMPQAI